MKPIRAVVAGTSGKMGSRIAAMLRADDGFTLAGAFERQDSPVVGQSIGDVPIGASIEHALQRGADVVIDFTAPQASLRHAQVCADRKVPLVVGTTGFSPEAKAELAGCARRTPIVASPNMSVGVNVLFRLVAEAARTLGSTYEVEVLEMHHRAKRDAPSGTALRLAEEAAGALGLDPRQASVHARDGETGPRKPGTIGVQTLRGGDVVGEHTVFFLADGERLELSHRATSRDTFARGALRAARWVVAQPPGLYDMNHVLGFPR